MKKVIVIGAGASGLMAAYAAAAGGCSVTVLEKNEKAGKKIYITGKGRCNVTNDTSAEGVLENVVHNAKFLTGAAHAFPPERLMRFLEEGGLPLKVERGNRVFPVSDKASDVTKCLERYCLNAGVHFRFKENVRGIEREGDGFLIRTEGETLRADAAIICTGGLSYPSTGSTGDGYVFAHSMGLRVVPPRPALCGIECMNVGGLQGLSLKNVTLHARAGKREYSHFGEMLFTHFGISGPIALTLSSEINGEEISRVRLWLDLKPALDETTLDRRLLRDIDKYKNKQMKNALSELLPKALILPVLQRAGISAELAANSLTKEKRAALLHAIKAFALSPQKLRPVEEGIVTAGGVDVKEIDPRTMMCRKVPGLYICGETLDVDAFTGGFNLQIAFMTGYAAGRAVCTATEKAAL